MRYGNGLVICHTATTSEDLDKSMFFYSFLRGFDENQMKFMINFDDKKKIKENFKFFSCVFFVFFRGKIKGILKEKSRFF